MILEQAKKAIENQNPNNYNNSDSCNIILKTPILEIMSSYNLSFDDATSLVLYAKKIDNENYWKFRVAQDKHFQEQEAIKKNITWFGKLLQFISGVIFIMCCFGGIIGIIIGIIICWIVNVIVEDNFSSKNQIKPEGKISPLVKDGDLDKSYLNLYKKQQYKKRHS